MLSKYRNTSDYARNELGSAKLSVVLRSRHRHADALVVDVSSAGRLAAGRPAGYFSARTVKCCACGGAVNDPSVGVPPTVLRTGNRTKCRRVVHVPADCSLGAELSPFGSASFPHVASGNETSSRTRSAVAGPFGFAAIRSFDCGSIRLSRAQDERNPRWVTMTGLLR